MHGGKLADGEKLVMILHFICYLLKFKFGLDCTVTVSFMILYTGANDKRMEEKMESQNVYEKPVTLKNIFKFVDFYFS